MMVIVGFDGYYEGVPDSSMTARAHARAVSSSPQRCSSMGAHGGELEPAALSAALDLERANA
jgi:hypothetical protein